MWLLQSGPDDKTDKDDGDSCSAGGNPPGTLPYLKMHCKFVILATSLQLFFSSCCLWWHQRIIQLSHLPAYLQMFPFVYWITLWTSPDEVITIYHIWSTMKRPGFVTPWQPLEQICPLVYQPMQDNVYMWPNKFSTITHQGQRKVLWGFKLAL